MAFPGLLAAADYLGLSESYVPLVVTASEALPQLADMASDSFQFWNHVSALPLLLTETAFQAGFEDSNLPWGVHESNEADGFQIETSNLFAKTNANFSHWLDPEALFPSLWGTGGSIGVASLPTVLSGQVAPPLNISDSILPGPSLFGFGGVLTKKPGFEVAPEFLPHYSGNMAPEGLLSATSMVAKDLIFGFDRDGKYIVKTEGEGNLPKGRIADVSRDIKMRKPDSIELSVHEIRIRELHTGESPSGMSPSNGVNDALRDAIVDLGYKIVSKGGNSRINNHSDGAGSADVRYSTGFERK